MQQLGDSAAVENVLPRERPALWAGGGASHGQGCNRRAMRVTDPQTARPANEFSDGPATPSQHAGRDRVEAPPFGRLAQLTRCAPRLVPHPASRDTAQAASRTAKGDTDQMHLSARAPHSRLTSRPPRTALTCLGPPSQPQPPACKPDPTPSPYKTRPYAVLKSGTQRGNGPNIRATTQRKSPDFQGFLTTGATGLEPATSGVTGRRSNQLSYAPAFKRARGKPSHSDAPCRRVCQARPPRRAPTQGWPASQ